MTQRIHHLQNMLGEGLKGKKVFTTKKKGQGRNKQRGVFNGDEIRVRFIIVASGSGWRASRLSNVAS